jgi:hypothetical protein
MLMIFQANEATNHAIIQSLVLKMSGHDQQQQQQHKVPPACCAPDRMDSVTLLYYDEHDNIVLKNFPKMAVISCSCK